MIDAAEDVGDLPEKCPKCGAATFFDYGLAGGGMGAYVYCENDDCEFFSKRQDEADDAQP